MSPSYTPGGMNFIDPNRNFAGARTRRVHHAQHFRANIRQTHPTSLFLDDEILASGLEEYEDYVDYDEDLEFSMDQFFSTPQPSPPCEESSPYCCALEEYMEEEGCEDGMISPLELPPRLLSSGIVDCDKSESMLLGSEPILDLEELDRRLELIARAQRSEEADLSGFDRWLESIARMERLGKAGLLDAFFKYASTARV